MKSIHSIVLIGAIGLLSSSAWANNPPVVNAGPNQNVGLGTVVNLDGTVTDDGLPNPPGRVTITWSKRSGPGTVNFGDPSQEDTTATFSRRGTYRLRLRGHDGQFRRDDIVRIIVSNARPQANAGPNQTVQFGFPATLAGSVTDDGFPNPPGVVTIKWTKRSGPGTVTFDDDTDLNTQVNFSAIGSYTLRLTADDGDRTDTDDVRIRVVANRAPRANAGPNQTITLPDPAVLDGSATDDGFPNPPGTLTYLWEKNSGPGTVTFDDNTALDTNAYFSTDGTYFLRLTADDSDLNDTDIVRIIVNPNPNSPPKVDAGTDQTITLPSLAQLSGTASDDGLPNPPGTMTYLWEKDSGPGTVNFGNATSLTTNASFSTDGVYVLKLTADDSQLKTTDKIQITVNPIPNTAPTVNAGGDQTITLPSQAVLSGTASDDGLPNPPGTLTYSWEKVSGPGSVNFTAPTSLNTNAGFSTDGVYVLKLTADDSDLNSSDEIKITVNPVPNTAPTVNAGNDQTITLPSQAVLSGTASDDGLPNPPGTLTYLWEKVSGPGTVNFSAATSLNTNASFSTDGVYVLKLTADDSELNSSDEVKITVSPVPNQPPTVNAGVDQSINLPSQAALSGTASDDGLPNPPGALTHLWEKGSGPGTVSFGDNTSLNTTAGFSTDGVYTLKLTTDDSEFTTSDEVQVTVGPVPNAAPQVLVGEDQTITLPQIAQLVGTATDDGNPNPPADLSVLWEKVAGPGDVNIVSPTLLETDVSFSLPGIYIIRVTVDDSEKVDIADTRINVNAAPQAAEPVVEKNIFNPDNGESVNIVYEITGNVSQDVTIKIYNIAGDEVRVLRPGAQNPGINRTPWNGQSDGGTVVTSGIYVYRIISGEKVTRGKIVVLR